jgi:two-component system chemotaxis response regulator CheB
MLAAQTDSVDRALWIALRSLEERAALTHRLSERASSRQHTWVAKAFQQRALAADQHAAVIRDLLTNRMSMHEVPDSVPEPPLQEVAPELGNKS